MDQLSDWLGARFVPVNDRLSPKHPLKVSLVLGHFACVAAGLQLAYAAAQTESLFSFQQVRLAGAGQMFFGPIVVMPLALWTGRSWWVSGLAALTSGSVLWLIDVGAHSTAISQHYFQQVIAPLSHNPALFTVAVATTLISPGFLIGAFAIGSFCQSRNRMAIGLCVIGFLLNIIWEGFVLTQSYRLAVNAPLGLGNWVPVTMYFTCFAFLPCVLALSLGVSIWDKSHHRKFDPELMNSVS